MVSGERPAGPGGAADQSIRVLLVDDDQDFLDAAGELLESESERLTVQTAASTDRALTMLDATAVNCIVSDYDMPGSDGLEFLATVTKREAEFPFILLTGKGSEEIASKAISAGVTDYLQKSGSQDQFAILANRIENAVDSHRSQRALAHSRRRMETLISTLPGMVYRCENDPDRPMEFVGGECEQLCGYTAEQIETDELYWGADVIVSEDRERVWEEAQEAVAEREQFELTYRIRTSDGEQRWAWERGRGIFDDGDVVALEGFITDVTERHEREEKLREREQELERENERLDRFVSLASHDLRNPLDAAQMRLELAQRECDSDHLDVVERSHDRREELLSDLLALARTGESVDEKTRIDLAAHVRRCWGTIDTTGADLTIDANRTVLAEESRLAQLFENLLRNAVQHGREGEDSTVQIQVGTLADGFYVEDDGLGIPVEERETVFEAGHSGNRTGTGFGLSIVRKIVTAHGWSIDITDGTDGGARFEITDVGPSE